ncbi:MAG: hypothetical protein PHN31_03130 [Candidatus Gracilibacteria bacterium]|nr:hypothetical protein [Candidatus Gracilibacteria bacterium]
MSNVNKLPHQVTIDEFLNRGKESKEGNIEDVKQVTDGVKEEVDKKLKFLKLLNIFVKQFYYEITNISEKNGKVEYIEYKDINTNEQFRVEINGYKYELKRNSLQEDDEEQSYVVKINGDVNFSGGNIYKIEHTKKFVNEVIKNFHEIKKD